MEIPCKQLPDCGKRQRASRLECSAAGRLMCGLQAVRYNAQHGMMFATVTDSAINLCFISVGEANVAKLVDVFDITDGNS